MGKNKTVISLLSKSNWVTPMNLNLDFSNYTGKNVRVGVIDSGINTSHPDVKSVQNGIAIWLDSDGQIFYTKNFNDTIGHGTSCAGIIQKIAPDVQLYGIKILDDSFSAHSYALAEAIIWAANMNINVVNLSLGTIKRTYKNKLKEACDYAYAKGVIIVSAGLNEGRESYVASFPNVLGVVAGECENPYEYFYQPTGQIEFVAYGKHRVVLHKYSYIKKCNSYAAPHIAGIVALILERYPGANFGQVKQVLIANSIRKIVSGSNHK